MDTVPERIDPPLCEISSLSGIREVIISVETIPPSATIHSLLNRYNRPRLTGQFFASLVSFRKEGTKAVQVFFEFQFLSGYVHDGNCYKVLGSLSFSVREKGEREREKCRLLASRGSWELTGSSLLKMHEHLQALANSFVALRRGVNSSRHRAFIISTVQEVRSIKAAESVPHIKHVPIVPSFREEREFVQFTRKKRFRFRNIYTRVVFLRILFFFRSCLNIFIFDWFFKIVSIYLFFLTTASL